MSIWATAGNTQNLTSAQVVENAVSGVIQPGYERLAGEAEITHESIAELCAEPTKANLQYARAAFASLVGAFGRIESIRFGPVLKDNRIDRLLFWPDRRGIGLRQVQAAIATGDQTVTAPETLAIKSVALQGLGALEFILYGAGAKDLQAMPTRGFRCRFALAVAARIHQTAKETANDWADDAGISYHLTNPGPKNPLYRNEMEALAELISVFVHGYESIRDVKLAPLTGSNGKAPKPKLAMLRRSSLTFAMLAANFDGLRHLFEVSGIGLLMPKDQQSHAGSALFEFRNAARVISEITLPVMEATKDPSQGGKIRYLAILTRSLQKITVESIVPALGITVGFSALDGD